MWPLQPGGRNGYTHRRGITNKMHSLSSHFDFVQRQCIWCHQGESWDRSTVMLWQAWLHLQTCWLKLTTRYVYMMVSEAQGWVSWFGSDNHKTAPGSRENALFTIVSLIICHQWWHYLCLKPLKHVLLGAARSWLFWCRAKPLLFLCYHPGFACSGYRFSEKKLPANHDTCTRKVAMEVSLSEATIMQWRAVAQHKENLGSCFCSCVALRPSPQVSITAGCKNGN